MMRVRSCVPRFAAAPLLAAAGLLLVACQSPQVPPWMQAGKTGPKPAAPASKPALPPARPAAKVVPTPAPTRPAAVPAPAPATIPAPNPARQAAPAPSQGPAPAPGEMPSLAPLLSGSPSSPAGVVLKEPPPPPPAVAPAINRVALLLPLTGANGRLGSELLNAAQLALFEFADEDFELVVHDTESTSDGAADAAALAIGDGASLLLGPLVAAEVRAVAPAARAAGINVIAFSSDRLVAGNGIYVMGFLPSAQVERIVGYARARGLLRFAAFVSDDGYGAAVVDALRGVAARVGAAVTRIQYYDPAAGDFSDAVRRLADYDSRRGSLLAQRAELEGRDDQVARRALRRLEKLQTIGDLPFDALLLPDGGKRLQAIAALLPFYDIDPAKIRILGTGQWDEPGIGAEPALLGGWFAAPSPAARAEFEARFAKAYGRRPPRLATLAYDAAALAAVLARGEDGPDFGAEALTAATGFLGRDGIFRFLDDGVAERGLAVLQVLRRGAKVISRAPEAFGVPTN